MLGPEPGVRWGFLSIQWPSLPLGLGQVPRGWNRSPEGCVPAGPVPFKSVCSSSSPHQHPQPQMWVFGESQAWPPLEIQTASDGPPVQLPVMAQTSLFSCHLGF